MSIVTYLTVIALAIGWTTIEADEVPAFFLKIAKNIPRVGRSGRLDDFLHEASKNIPRTASRDGYIPSTGSSLKSYTDDEINHEPHKRMINVAAPGNLDALSWEHFPLAIEGPPELWRTLASYTNDKYGTSSDDVFLEKYGRYRLPYEKNRELKFSNNYINIKNNSNYSEKIIIHFIIFIIRLVIFSTA